MHGARLMHAYLIEVGHARGSFKVSISNKDAGSDAGRFLVKATHKTLALSLIHI